MYRVQIFKKLLDNLNISDYHGLKSSGLTCYLNSVLQVLFMTPEFRNAVKSKVPGTLDCHLDHLFRTLEINLAETRTMTKQLGIKDVYEQRDAAEYFEKILCLTSPDASKIFKGELNHKITCCNCKQTSNDKNFFWVLPLSMEVLNSKIYCVEGLNSFFKMQKVCDNNQIFCNICKGKQDADIEYEMTESPEVLTLLLKRFTFSSRKNCFVKLHCHAEVADTLITKRCSYELYAIVHHFGGLSGGHYIADIRSFENKNWYSFDDSVVKRCTQHFEKTNTTRSDTAYLLMYRKVRKENPAIKSSDLKANITSSVHTKGSVTQRDLTRSSKPPHLESSQRSKLMFYEDLPFLAYGGANGDLQSNTNSAIEGPRQNRTREKQHYNSTLYTDNPDFLSPKRNGVMPLQATLVNDGRAVAEAEEKSAGLRKDFIVRDSSTSPANSCNLQSLDFPNIMNPSEKTGFFDHSSSRTLRKSGSFVRKKQQNVAPKMACILSSHTGQSPSQSKNKEFTKTVNSPPWR